MSLAVSMESMKCLVVSLKMAHGAMSFDMKPTQSPVSLSTSCLEGMKINFKGRDDGAGCFALDIWVSMISDSDSPRVETESKKNDQTSPDRAAPALNHFAMTPFLLSSGSQNASSPPESGQTSRELGSNARLSLPPYPMFDDSNESIDMADVFSGCDMSFFGKSPGKIPSTYLDAFSCMSDLDFPSLLPPDDNSTASSVIRSSAGSSQNDEGDKLRPVPVPEGPEMPERLNEQSPLSASEPRSPSFSDSPAASPLNTDAQTSDSDSSSSRPYPCLHPGCTRWFTRRYTRTVHMGTHTRNENRARFACGVPGCTHRFSRKHDRLRHEVTQHGKSSEWKCEICRLHFSFPSRLERHLRDKHQ